MKLLTKLMQEEGMSPLWGAILLVLVFGLLSIAPSPAHGATDSPFAVDSTSWMSLDRYADKKQRFPDQFPSESESVVQNVIPPNELVKTNTADAPAAASPAPSKESLYGSKVSPVAQPLRALNLPSLPSVNGGYDVRVTSTEDEGGATALLKDLATQPKLELRDTDWMNAKKAARLAARAAKDKLPNGGENVSIRFANLPNQTLIPTSVPKAMKDTKIAAQTPVPPAPEAKKNALDPAVCAAVNALKKRQLHAIESDRKTLAALQAAIAELKLGDKLDFMGAAAGSVSTQAGTAPAASFLDAPVTAPTAKN